MFGTNSQYLIKRCSSLRSYSFLGFHTSSLAQLPNTASDDSIRKRGRALFFVDSVFPIQLGTWEYVSILFRVFTTNVISLRHYIALLREPAVCGAIKNIVKEIDVQGYKLLNVEPR